MYRSSSIMSTAPAHVCPPRRALEQWLGKRQWQSEHCPPTDFELCRLGSHAPAGHPKIAQRFIAGCGVLTMSPSPVGTTEVMSLDAFVVQRLSRPYGTPFYPRPRSPAMNRWAILIRSLRDRMRRGRQADSGGESFASRFWGLIVYDSNEPKN